MTYRPLANEEYAKEKDEDTHSTTPLAHFGSSLDDPDITNELINKVIPDKEPDGGESDGGESEGESDEDDLHKSTTVSAAAPGFKIARIVLTILIFVIVIGLIAGSVVLIITSPSCPPQLAWWQTAVIYQVYPQSFQHTDTDETNITAAYGDLKGIISRLDYLENTLGVTAVWINPIYASPMVDNGYDISDYYTINPLYGTMQDFDTLLDELHSRNMKLIMDFVPNHTSDQHQWFQNCINTSNSEYCERYVWREPNSDGGPPNNWLSVFNGSAWNYSESRQLYYLHQFYSEQPDLNHRNKKVKEEMKNVLKFWLDKGVDGFRVDAVPFLLEDLEFRDEPENPDFNGSNDSDYNSLQHIYTTNVRGVHTIVEDWRKTVDCYSEPEQEKVFIGEVYSDVHTVMDYYGTKKKEFDFPFNFFLIGIQEWNATTVRDAVHKWWYALPNGAWPNWVLGNHDNPRIATRAGPNLVRALNLLLLTLPGTPTTYYGDEIGMTNLVDLPEGHDDERDAERSPMQWNTTTNAGFSNSTPWLPVATNYSTVNVEVESNKNQSLLELFCKLIHLRSHNEALKYSRYIPLNTSGNVYAFRRDKEHANNVAIVLINFDSVEVTEDLSELSDVPKREYYIAVSTLLNRTEIVDLSSIHLAPHEGIVLIGK